jgi:RNA polymerase sigma factor (sigma-70 family)
MGGDAADRPVSALVAGALAGDQRSWDAIVERYTPLVLSVVRRQRLSPADAEDVVQTVWLRLIEHLRGLREPGALPGYIVQTATHECYRLFGARRHVLLMDPTGPGLPERNDAPEVDSRMLATERQEILLAALAELPDRQRALLLLFLEDPSPSYEEISRRLDMPIGSIGPTRARALARLREIADVLALR